MRAIRRLAQLSAGRHGLRLLMVVIYAILAARFYYSGQDMSVFMGMFRVLPPGAHADIALNMYPLLFMAGGIAISLEQCSEYLLIPDFMVYVRRRRGVSHYCRYCLIVLVYSVLFTGVQLVVAEILAPAGCAGQIALTAVCAAWTLVVLMLVVNLGYMLGYRAIGYFVAAGLYLALLSLNGLERWLLSPWVFAVPHWVPALLLASVALFVANLVVFERVEIY